MPDIKGQQYLALVWIFRDAPYEWFDDFPALIDTKTVHALFRKNYIEKNTKGKYRLTPEGRELARRLNSFARSDVQRSQR